MSRTILSRRLVSLERRAALSRRGTCFDLIFPGCPDLQARYPIQGLKEQLQIVFVEAVDGRRVQKAGAEE